MLIGPCVWRLFSQLIKFHINGWDNIGNIIKAHPFNYLWRRLGLLFCGYGSQISPLSSASLKSQILSTYGLYELRYVGTLFFFLLICALPLLLQHGRRLPLVSSVRLNERNLTVNSSSTGYDLMRLGSILNRGYCFWVPNSPCIVPEGHGGIEAAI